MSRVKLRNKEYTMLIRGMKEYNDTTDTKISCYSLISNENSSSYGADYLLHYGYDSLDVNKVLHVLEQDSFSYDTKEETPTNYVNRIMTPRELIMNSSWYSEIDIINDKNENGKYTAKKPNFIVAYDIITNRDLKEAKRLNLPIVIIEENNLKRPNDFSYNLDSDYKYVTHSADVTYGRRIR